MISSDFYWFYIISIDIGYTSSIMTNGNINLYNQLHFTWLSLPNAQCPHLTTTHGPTQQLVGVTSGHCYNQPLQPVLSSSWQHNADNDGHSPSPSPPHTHPPPGATVGDPGGHTHQPSIHGPGHDARNEMLSTILVTFFPQTPAGSWIMIHYCDLMTGG